MVDLVLMLLNINSQFLFKDWSCHMTKCLKLWDKGAWEPWQTHRSTLKVLSLLSVAMINNDQKHHGGMEWGERFIWLTGYIVHHLGKVPRQKLKSLEAETTKESYLLAYSPITRAHLPRNGIKHSGQGPSKSIINQENASTDMYTGKSYKGSFSVEAPFSQITLVCFKLTKT